MNRAALAATIALVLLLASLTAAQQATKVWRIGVLRIGSPAEALSLVPVSGPQYAIGVKPNPFL